MSDVLPGGRFSRPVRKGNTVERKLGPGHIGVHAVLRHLEEKQFSLSPRLLGITPDGEREVLSFIEGDTGYPPISDEIRTDEALHNVGQAIRCLHDATADLARLPSLSASAFSPLDISVPVEIDCIGHGDLAPWNIVFAGTSVAGFIDWDAAGPSSRAWDLAYAAFQFVPMHRPHPVRGLEDWGWPNVPDRRRRLRLLCEAYGDGVSPGKLVDLAIVRLVSMAAHMESQISAGNADFDVHRAEGHPSGYRAAATYVIEQHESWAE
ncbi:phosphotransferase [Actinoplanes sp. NPDC051633]|uniref:phosphotransferase n=1 Tax=Actinoplanes sp. NPDC051633 TaxID=3155670 RepID=UPI0034319E8B